MILQTTSRFVYSVQTYMLMFLKWNTSFGDTTGRTKASTNFTTLSQNKRRKTGTQVFLTQQTEPKHQQTSWLSVKTRNGKLEHNRQDQNINKLWYSQSKQETETSKRSCTNFVDVQDLFEMWTKSQQLYTLNRVQLQNLVCCWNRKSGRDLNKTFIFFRTVNIFFLNSSRLTNTEHQTRMISSFK